ncbi:MAG: LamG domain-containing protein, partial [Myxococcales bacterium]|nr:LamG domain-containing protein [Myxococcales bacterium]
DHLWIYYGNPVAEGDTQPAEVWPDPFVGVWHLEDDPLDSTGNGNDAVPGGSTSPAAGQLANGRDFASTDARLDVAAEPSLEGIFAGGGTVSAWIRPRSWGGNAFGRIVDKASPDAGWQFFTSDPGVLHLSVVFEPGSSVGWATPEGLVSLDRWTYVAATYDALGVQLPRLYVDGVEQVLAEPDGQPVVERFPLDLEIPLVVGNREDGTRRFDGIIDELRIERTQRSAEWIGMQYDSTRDALLEYGPIESWGGPA